MPRLFVALDLPGEQKDQLLALCNGLPGARWARDRQFHLSLCFLGETDGPTFQRVRDALHGVRSDPFELALSGVGHFPPRGAPRVLWAGIESCPELLDLHAHVVRVLRRAGIAPEERRYAPHVTLARLRDTPLPRLVAFVREHAELRSAPFPVTDFQLFSSTLGSQGAQHRVEASYPLFAARPERGRARADPRGLVPPEARPLDSPPARRGTPAPRRARNPRGGRR
jgi:2'-5' RNA ligase